MFFHGKSFDFQGSEHEICGLPIRQRRDCAAAHPQLDWNVARLRARRLFAGFIELLPQRCRHALKELLVAPGVVKGARHQLDRPLDRALPHQFCGAYLLQSREHIEIGKDTSRLDIADQPGHPLRLRKRDHHRNCWIQRPA
jgi:hypothetical protein